MVSSKVYVAKIPLYATLVGKEGIIRNEENAEAIPEGAKFRIEWLGCFNKRLVLSLRQKAEARLDRVKIYLYLSKKQRAMPDAEEQLMNLMGHVMVLPAMGDDPGDSD